MCVWHGVFLKSLCPKHLQTSHDSVHITVWLITSVWRSSPRSMLNMSQRSTALFSPPPLPASAARLLSALLFIFLRRGTCGDWDGDVCTSHPRPTAASKCLLVWYRLRPFCNVVFYADREKCRATGRQTDFKDLVKWSSIDINKFCLQSHTHYSRKGIVIILWND